MRKIFIVITFILASFVLMLDAEAKWWIFGQGNDEVNINYLYINKNSFDETGQKIVMYKETLQGGKINITGKASVRSGKIGAVYVSKDNRETWEKADLSNNGAFQYGFTPDLDREYDLYIKIIDTTGKTNNVEDTYRQIKMVDENITQIVANILNVMIKAYELEQPNNFMAYVSPDFTGDEAVLDSAIRKDFNAFDYIQLKYFINNISADSSGKIFVAINYNRTVVSTKSGRTYSDNGYTELVFRNQEGKPKLYNMKNPLIFGLSDAGNVATGTIQNTNNEPILVVDSNGDMDEKPFRDAITIIENESDITNDDNSNVLSGTFVLNEFEGFIFESQSTFMGGHLTDIYLTDDAGAGRALNPTGRGPAEYSSIGACDLSSQTQAPSGGYTNDIIFPIVTGACYALNTVDDTYALIKVTSYNAGAGTATIQYKYQTNGSRDF